MLHTWLKSLLVTFTVCCCSKNKRRGKFIVQLLQRTHQEMFLVMISSVIHFATKFAWWLLIVSLLVRAQFWRGSENLMANVTCVSFLHFPHFCIMLICSCGKKDYLLYAKLKTYELMTSQQELSLLKPHNKSNKYITSFFKLENLNGNLSIVLYD